MKQLNIISAAEEKTLVSTKQLAKQLNTSSKVILENAKKCLPNKVIENGKPTYWTKEETTVLLDCLKNNPQTNAKDLYLESKGCASTDLTPALKIKKAMELMQEGYQEEIARLKALNCEQEKQLAEQQPKVEVYEDLVERNKTMNFRDMAAKLGMKQTEFMTLLRSKYIYKNRIGEYRAYAPFQKLFTLRTFARGVEKTGDQLLLTMTGICFFLAKYGQNKAITATADKWIDKNLPELAHDNI